MDGGRANWDDETTKIFLDLCIVEKENLNYTKKGLTKQGWQNLYANFRRKSRRAYGCKQLQNKFNSLKRQYSVWKKLKNRSGSGWDKRTGTLNCTSEWWDDRIAENEENKQFRKKPLNFDDELSILFDSMDNEDDTMLWVGGIGDRTPSGRSEDNNDQLLDDNIDGSEDNVGRSSVGRAAHRSGKEHLVDSPPPKKTKRMEDYVASISDCMMERIWNERSVISRKQEEVTELLQPAEQDGVSNGSELYFIAAELFRSPARRATYRSITAADRRIAWIRWTWDNVKKR